MSVISERMTAVAPLARRRCSAPTSRCQQSSVSRERRARRRARAAAARATGTRSARTARARPASTVNSATVVRSSPLSSTRRAEHERVRARRSRVEPSPSRAAPTARSAVVEADDELAAASARAPRTPSTMRTTSGAVAARRHEVDDAHGAVVGLELGLEHERVVAVAALDVAHRVDRGAISQRPCSGVAEQCGEARAASRSAGRTASRSSRRAPTSAAVWQVADQRVVLDPRHQRSSIPRAKRRKRRRTAWLKARSYSSDASSSRSWRNCHGGRRGSRSGLDEVDVVAVALFGLIAVGPVVRPLGRDAASMSPRCSRSKRSSCRSMSSRSGRA